MTHEIFCVFDLRVLSCLLSTLNLSCVLEVPILYLLAIAMDGMGMDLVVVVGWCE